MLKANLLLLWPPIVGGITTSRTTTLHVSFVKEKERDESWRDATRSSLTNTTSTLFLAAMPHPHLVQGMSWCFGRDLYQCPCSTRNVLLV
ncbi:hypothetical protein AAHA92_31040 [Salvia divinorum]|uniref:Secreted protein n=1 Tax=Salvia divinorum TaxID=28513 RepID=A0ABD1FVQ4_SALDI